LVEADVATRGVWARAVTAAGHAVITARETRDAIVRVREGGVDLVVIDVCDPLVGVVELARGIEQLPDAPPIVLISGSPASPQISARIGAALFLAKPCEPSEVVTAISALIERLYPAVRLDDTRPIRRLG
jgi:DNA-binding response OmpR family regulator